MTKNPRDINPARNEKYRHLEKFSYLPKLIILASVSLIVAVLFAALSVSAIKTAIKVELRSEQQIIEIEELSDSIKVYRIRAAKLDAWLKAKGVPIEEIYDE